jgi:hypothetical protein
MTLIYSPQDGAYDPAVGYPVAGTPIEYLCAGGILSDITAQEMENDPGFTGKAYRYSVHRNQLPIAVQSMIANQAGIAQLIQADSQWAARIAVGDVRVWKVELREPVAVFLLKG